MDYEKKLADTARLVEKALAEYMKTKDIPHKRVFEAMSYSLLAGGKRMRPVIMLYVCEMCGGNTEAALPFACAIEMIHTYSLIHDDLPAMDNDDLRRGRPTNHIQFDEATAILAGDALLNTAFEITSSKNDGVNAEDVLRVISVLARCSGANGMIGGQMIDIENENKSMTIDELKYLHSLKTGALIRASGVCGAIIAGANEKSIKAVDEFCSNLGIAFQIRDDILDVTGNEKELGKKTGSDLQNNKNTYVTLTSLEEAERLSGEYTAKAKKSLEIFGEKADGLLYLADKLLGRKN